MILHVLYTTSSEAKKKHPMTLAHLHLSARFACPNAVHLQKMVGLPRTFRQPKSVGNQKVWLQKTCLASSNQNGLLKKKIVGLLNNALQIYLFTVVIQPFRK